MFDGKSIEYAIEASSGAASVAGRGRLMVIGEAEGDQPRKIWVTIEIRQENGTRSIDSPQRIIALPEDALLLMQRAPERSDVEWIIDRAPGGVAEADV
ncbi:hypothetical protein [Luteolibacter rhizosphaerae]|nr:hypothetical protein [Luteolibacter rhizosphaerae]